ncbi:MAG: hypothetical protein E7555_09775 [Ruminococcaceae bacterium]|nr:hypothetical protein [Oscillospiraceae bacterium]
MSDIFIHLLNMSITASYLVLATILLRLIFKKAPKTVFCFLWFLVGLRLIFPFSIESALSLIPTTQTFPEYITTTDSPSIHSGSVYVNQVVNSAIYAMKPNPGDSVNPMQVFMEVASYVWIAGVVIMLIYSLISYLRLRKKVAPSINTEENIFLCDYISSPFILGVFKPKIYIPSSIDEENIKHVLLHEKSHLKRKDHLWKPLGFLLLSVYWFNPVMWVAYILLCRDIELACDEKVIKEMGKEETKAYSEALLNCSVSRHAISACPVAFGENGVRGRIKSILNYKKPAFWVIVIAVIASLIITICFMTNPLGMKLTELCEFNASYSLYYKVSTPDGTYSSYENEEIEEMYKKLQKVRIDETPIDQSRSEERDKTNSVSFGKITFYFSSDHTTVWVSDGVKPSYTYEVKNPETLPDIFEQAVRLSAVAYKSETETEGISIRLKEINVDDEHPYMTVEYINDTDYNFTYGADYMIYRIEGKEKVSCEKEDLAFDLPLYHLFPKNSTSETCPLSMFDLSVPGTYRFEKQYGLEKPDTTEVVKNAVAWIEFEVSEKEELSLSSKITELTTGTVLFYDKPTVEYETPDIKYYNKFSEKDFEIFLSSLKANNWTSDLLTDRINFDFDGEIHCDDGYRVYFGFDQKIVYCNEYYSDMTQEQITTLKKMKKSAEKIETSDERTEVTKGNTETYVFENSVDPLNPTLTLNKDEKTFCFSYSGFSSYVATGTYRWEDNMLILSAEDEKHGYAFRKEDDTLVFDAGGSSPIPEYKYNGEDSSSQSPVPHGAVFELKEKTMM